MADCLSPPTSLFEMDLTICVDVERNPGEPTKENSDSTVPSKCLCRHCRLPANRHCSKYDTYALRSRSCRPDNATLQLLKLNGILKSRGSRGGKRRPYLDKTKVHQIADAIGNRPPRIKILNTQPQHRFVPITRQSATSTIGQQSS